LSSWGNLKRGNPTLRYGWVEFMHLKGLRSIPRETIGRLWKFSRHTCVEMHPGCKRITRPATRRTRHKVCRELTFRRSSLSSAGVGVEKSWNVGSALI
jgi:hypothetical protein